MPTEEHEALAQNLKVNLVQNPSKYLGINFKLRGNRVSDFQFLIDKLNSKLQGWKAKLLSQVGRTTLISFVLQSLPLYTFSCFRNPEQLCNKMDAIVRAFWWGHEQGEKKLHLINQERICQSKRKGGLGLKKFGLMNQAMLAKQYWRINQNPSSLLARTSKAKYFPNYSIQDCTPKPHHSWFRKKIIKQDNPKLGEGKWRIGNGFSVPLNHQNWFPHPYLNLDHPRLPTGIVGDLIDQNTTSWKDNLVKVVYPFPLSTGILQIPLSKTGSVQDKLLWKFSGDGDYKV